MNKYKRFKKEYKKFVESLHPNAPATNVYDFVTEFCEKYDMLEDLLICKFNTSALYAWCQYKSGDKDLEWFKKALIAIDGYDKKEEKI